LEQFKEKKNYYLVVKSPMKSQLKGRSSNYRKWWKLRLTLNAEVSLLFSRENGGRKVEENYFGKMGPDQIEFQLCSNASLLLRLLTLFLCSSILSRHSSR
jgi:hypothetical protein